jgi:BMFP domain-containing protein YqiC
VNRSLKERLAALEAKVTAEEALVHMDERGNSALDYERMFALLLERIQALEAKLHRQPFNATHNDPALPAGQCDCGGFTGQEEETSG